MRLHILFLAALAVLPVEQVFRDTANRGFTFPGVADEAGDA